MRLIRGQKYRFKYQQDTPDLMYIGARDRHGWHQFTKFDEGRFGKVWLEARGSDLHLLEWVEDWSKSHNGVMLCTFKQTEELMPEVMHILDELKPTLEAPEEDYLVDVKIHMLMPDQIPCIPNWHYDFLARDCKGERIKSKTSDKKMYMWLSSAPLTEYKKGGKIYTKPARQWHSFTQRDLHRGAESKEHVWRCFIRVIPKEFAHGHTINMGTKRVHTQVYLDANTYKW